VDSKWFWVLVAGVIGGFAFAAGSSLYSRTEDKMSKLGIGLPTAGSGGPGSRTQNTPGVY